MTTISQNETRVHQILRLPRKHDLQKHLSFWPWPANLFATCRKCHACHADERVSDVLRLSRKTTFVPKVPPLPRKMDIAMAQKNKHGALVNLHLRKRQNRAAHLVRALAVKAHGHLTCASLSSQKPQTRRRTLIWPRPFTPTLRTPQSGHSVCGKKRSALLVQPISAPCGSRDADSPAPEMRPVNSPQDSHRTAPWPNPMGLGCKL